MLDHEQVFNKKQENDLVLFFQISNIFDKFYEYTKKNGIECMLNPFVWLNSYKSQETNFEWRYFDGRKVNYTGEGPTGYLYAWDYTAFGNNTIFGKL